MGQVCAGAASSNTTFARDPADKSLDAVVMAPTKIPEFDDLFTEAAGPLNSLVELNNGVAFSVEDIKEASAVVQGDARIAIEKQGSAIAMVMYQMDDKGKDFVVPEEKVNEINQKSPEVTEAFNGATQSLEKLNEAISSAGDNATKWELRNNRIFITASGDFDEAIINFTIQCFVYRKSLLLDAAKPGLKGAVEVIIKELGDKAQEMGPRIKVDDEGKPEIVFGEMSDISGDGAGKDFPPRLNRLKKCFESFQENAGNAVDSVPGIKDQLETLANKASEFPEKVSSACGDAGLSPMQIPKATKATSSNMKLLSGGVQIANSVMSTIKESSAELKDACALPTAA